MVGQALFGTGLRNGNEIDELAGDLLDGSSRYTSFMPPFSISYPAKEEIEMEARNWAIAVWGLYLVSFVTVGITALIGLIIAYVKRPDLRSTPFGSHMTSAIRTFWISLIVGLIGLILSAILIGYFVLLLIGLWSLFRCVRGLIKAVDNKPIDDPLGWF
jgi:uncharacterized membrane protein